MKLIYLTTCLVLFGIVLLPATLSLTIKKIPNGYQPPLTDSQAVDKDISISQLFSAKNDNLSAIGLSIKNPYYRNNQDLFFKLYNSQNQLQRQVTLNGQHINDGSLYVINFDPIPNSTGHLYYFTLTAPEVNPADALEVYHSQIYLPETEYFVNNQLQKGTLSFIYYWTPNNPLANLIFIYRNWFSKFFQDLPFAFFYLMIIAGISIYLVKAFLKEKLT